jgi:hypothetical protein
MGNLNDDKILLLKNKIEEKEKQLKIKKFVPVTNCIFNLEGTVINLHTANKPTLIKILVDLDIKYTSAKKLGYENNYFISGYGLEEWMEDVKTKLSILENKNEEDKLKSMKNQLQELLSNEKKAELQINEIEASLK